jgi:hypothetical protein
MSHMLLHDIGANDGFTLHDLLYDSWKSRLVYKALCGYDTETCAISNAGGVWTSLRPQLEAVLPAYMYVVIDRRDDDISDDNDAQGVV